jgi:hypothetical protein
MGIRVIYSTEAFLAKDEGQLGKQFELSFASLAEAKSAPLPAGYVFAFISAEDGNHTYSAKLGWEFHRKK